MLKTCKIVQKEAKKGQKRPKKACFGTILGLFRPNSSDKVGQTSSKGDLPRGI